MKRIMLLSISLLALSFLSCQRNTGQSNKKEKKTADVCNYVDPFIGTGAHGHTFPGPCLPHGMVQLSPDTGEHGWDWCSGYHDTDHSVMGFSMTHLSGTGAADLGDILFMAYNGAWKTKPGSKAHPNEGYRSVFSHKQEHASVGYYSVFLKSYGIKAELTVGKRSGMMRYTFPKTGNRNIIIDLNRGIQNHTVSSAVHFVGNNAIEGYRQSHGWANDRYVYFYAKFSQPFEKHAIVENGKIIGGANNASGKVVKALVRFAQTTNKPLLVKVGISAVSMANAKANLESGIPGWNFDQVRKDAVKTWEKALSKITVKGGTKEQLRTFYTALYHALLAPYLYSDVNGQYVGMDRKVHTANFNYYTVFSLWDTFRAAHPLYQLIEPGENNDFVKTMLTMYKQEGHLPVWELDGNETWCMIGTHSVSVIADDILHGQPDFSIPEAYQAMKSAVDDTIRGLKAYHKYGYVPDNVESNSVSRTVEDAYTDWCVAQVAKKLGKMADYRKYMKRAENFKNLFNPANGGFLQGKNTKGQWRKNFNPIDVSRLGSDDFTEGNSWQYTFFAPQDVDGLIHLIGSRKAFIRKLNALFDQPSINNNPSEPDVSGMIGQYAQGNEPSHEIAYLYDYAGAPYETASHVRLIMDSLYNDTRNGLCGNDDCGQMSAWYVFGAMGFYPVNPASGVYAIGSPLFPKLTLHTGSKKPFTVEAKNVSKKNMYIQSATLNGKDYPYSWITQKQIEQGGKLVFHMGDKPSKWATKAADCPVSKIKL